MEPVAQAIETKSHPKAPDRIQTEFISVVSHELRTPVSAIQGYTDLLLEGAYGELQPGQREIVGYMKQSAGGLLAMINNLLSLSFMNRGQTDLVLKTFKLEEVIKDVLTTCRADYELKKLSVSYRIEPNDLSIHSDRIKLQQILTNLVTNAIRYTPKGWVQIDARTTQDSDSGVPMLQLDVSDSGVGITKEDQERVFEQFYRAGGSSDTERDGMGLGLYIVHSLARMLGGQISVKSKLQSGSTFSVRMPVVFEEAKALQNMVQFNQAALQRNGNEVESLQYSSTLQRVVIFLGDDPHKCSILAGTLRHEGIQVVQVPDMQQVVEKVNLLRPVAIIFDPIYKDGNRGQLFHELKLNPATKSIPVLFFMESTTSTEVPAVTKVANEIDRQQKGHKRNGPYRVLVTDDDPGMREALQMALESEGYIVLLAGDGEEALQLLMKEHPDLMLLDLMMPRLNGWELIDILSRKPELRSTKVLMLTGTSLSLEEIQKLKTHTGGLMRKDEMMLNNILAGVAQAIGHG